MLTKNEGSISFDLRFTYEGRAEPSLVARGWIAPGETVVLCGPSGCGKTTLLRCMNRLIPYMYEGRLEGEVCLSGRSIGDMSVGEAGLLAATVFQDPRSQFFTLNSSTEIAFGLENRGLPHGKMRERVEEAFRRFGLERLKGREVYRLSAGERQLVAVLSAWAMETPIVLLDEPTANLDAGSVAILGRLLRELKEQGKTLVICEHRLHDVKALADRYLVMSAGRIVRELSAAEMEGLTEEERAGLSLRSLNPERMVPNPRPSGEEPLWTARGLEYRFGRREVLRGADLEIRKGEILGLIGANGSGKTTLGKLITGLYKPDAGEILSKGRPLSRRALRENGMFIFQEAELQCFTNSVENELMYGRDESARPRMEELLRRFGMEDLKSRHPFSLSGGQMQLLSLMLAGMSTMEVVVLDEPTAGLDAINLEASAMLAREMAREKAVIVITHDIEWMAKACDRVEELSEGRCRDVGWSGAEDMSRIYKRMAAYEKCGEEIPEIARRRGMDPRSKLLLSIAGFTAISLVDPRMIWVMLATLLIVCVEEGFVLHAAINAGIVGAFVGLGLLFPGTAFGYLSALIPRVCTAALAGVCVAGRDEAARTLAGLRKLRVPERLLMVFAVIFRFFPVLSQDMRLVREALRIRGAFPGWRRKLGALPVYVEMLIIPMALRVIRIAETLSASAECRGIDLPGRRESFVAIQFGPRDLLVALPVLFSGFYFI